MGESGGQSWEEPTLCDFLMGLEAVEGVSSGRRGFISFWVPWLTSQSFTPRKLPLPTFFQILLLELGRRETSSPQKTQDPNSLRRGWEGRWVSWAAFSSPRKVQFQKWPPGGAQALQMVTLG